MKNLTISRVEAIKDSRLKGADNFAIDLTSSEIYVSTPANLYCLDKEEIVHTINWQNARKDAEVILLTARSFGQSQVVAVLSDGKVLVVENKNNVIELECTEISDKSTAAAAWSTDEQYLAICDNVHLVLLDSSLITVTERLLKFSENEQKNLPVNVGWGSELTQFRGSAGKIKPEEENKPENIENNSNRTVVEWRYDGAYVAVSYIPPNSPTRILTLFNKNCEVLSSMNVRNIHLAHSFAIKPNSNLICSSILKQNHDEIAFYEQNGETRNGYSVKWPKNSRRIIEKLSWNSTDERNSNTTNFTKISQTCHVDVGNFPCAILSYDSTNFILWKKVGASDVVQLIDGDNGKSIETIFEGKDIGWVGVNPITQNIEIATLNGMFFDARTKTKILEIDKFLSVQVIFVKSFRVILTDDACLYLNSEKIAHNVTSFLPREHQIIFIDFENKLRFLDIELGTIGEDIRDVEIGSELMACDARSANVVLQAPRGNLETIQPRRFVIAETRRLLDQEFYIPAFKWMKKHRIDLSYAIEYEKEKLANNCAKWLDNTVDSPLLEQLVVSCTEKFPKEGNVLCEAIHQIILGSEDLEQKTKLFPLLLTSLLRSDPPRIKDSLKAVIKHSELLIDRRDVFIRQSLHHISFFVPSKELFNCALSTYDLNLAQQVAEASNADPKEYLPVLNNLKKVKCPLEFKYRVDVVREAWVEVLDDLFILDSSESRGNDETWWKYALDIMQRETMQNQALMILKPSDKRYKDCCAIYAAELEKKLNWREAALFYEMAGYVEKTLKCWEMSRDVDGMANSARRLSVEPAKLKLAAIKMSATLKEARMYRECAKAQKLTGATQAQIISILCEGFEWEMALKEVDHIGVNEILKKAASTRQETITTELTRRKAEFDKYFARLQIVRENKLKKIEKFSAGEVEDFRDDISSISSISSRSSRASMASSVRKKKQVEKKKNSLKEGGEFEDSALLINLAEHYSWVEQIRKEISQLIPVLISVGLMYEGMALRISIQDFTEQLIKQKNAIWPEVLHVQHLPGPLHMLFDPNQEQSPIPMPPVFKLEPELVAPNPTFVPIYP
ncbi:unnamed protein product [Caenorhabditis bovis]|uniref:Elongator complex protein 1 n=1 Tax=Caenorhabditis bovis TaxID=2654633 RepID=A0A8S1F4E7_9PELO|nr:unnamed protein product [Caenorhabditis bovis]